MKNYTDGWSMRLLSDFMKWFSQRVCFGVVLMVSTSFEREIDNY